MNRDKRGLSLGTMLTLALTIAVIVGCIVFFAAFRSDADVVMSAQKMAGLLEEAVQSRKKEALPSTVRTVTVTLAPVVQISPTAAETPKPGTT